jgi:UDP-3-O-[3-hydroxymyristoyl] glucosamine N-acyltransferase
MEKSLREIAELVGGEIEGDPDTIISGVSGIKEAQEGEITFVANARYTSLIETTGASAIIVTPETRRNGKKTPFLRAENPYLAFLGVVDLWVPQEPTTSRGIHPTAVVGKNVKMGADCTLGAYTVIGDEVTLGDRVTVYPHVVIGDHVEIGNETMLYPHVTVRERVSIGSRVIIHSGTRIGCDGFGFAPIKGQHHKVPQVGTVVIEDDVEVGANVTIDRATFQKTLIKKGTKIDNLVQIAHNVEVGENSIIVAQVGISGSTKIGNGVTLAGQAGIVGHIEIGDGAIVTARAGVTKNVEPYTCVSGLPATPHDKWQRMVVVQRRLPEINKQIRRLEKRLSTLEQVLDAEPKND